MCCCSGSLKLGSLCLECSAADWKIKNLSNAEKSAWAGCLTTAHRLSGIIDIIKGSYTKEEGMQLIETAKFERLLKIALSHAHALKIIIVVMDIECT